MIQSKYSTPVVAVFLCLALIISLVMIGGAGSAQAAVPDYEERLFNGETVTIDIEVDADDWQSLLDNAQSKEYISADLLINGERFSTVGVRTKGNSSLMTGGGNGRYSLQLNPNKYVDGQSFYGLDSLCINNLMGDATYMKDYISYEIMDYLGVPAPLHNYAEVRVNGEAYGLFLLLERYDDSFLDRVYGATTGELYNVKMAMGERNEFEAGDFEPTQPGGQGNQPSQDGADSSTSGATGGDTPADIPEGFEPPEGFEGMQPGTGGQMPEGFGGPTQGEENSEAVDPEGSTSQPEDAPATEGGGEETPQFPGGMGGMGGFSSGGGSLVYTDDDPASYGSIFNNAVSNKVSDNDQQQVITAIQKLNEGEDLEEYWDVDEILRYLAAHTFVVNLDSYVSMMQQNYYILERNGVLSILPWDYNLSFGGYQSGDAASVVNFPIDTPVSGVSMEDRPLVSQLLAVEEYRERYHGYLNDIVEGYVNSGLFEETVDRVDAQINEGVQNDATAYYTHEEYEAALPVFKELVTLRAESVAGQLDGSIPATTEEQSADSSRLVDASDINLTALGSMGGGGGGGMAGFGDFGGEGGSIPQDSFGGGDTPTAPEDATVPEDAAAAEDDAAMPDMSAMQDLLEAVQSGELTDAQRELLEQMGLTEENLAQMGEMFGGGTLPGTDGTEAGEEGGGAATQDRQMEMGPLFGTGGQEQTVTLTAGDWVVYGIAGALLAVAIVLVARWPRRRWSRSESG